MNEDGNLAQAKRNHDACQKILWAGVLAEDEIGQQAETWKKEGRIF